MKRTFARDVYGFYLLPLFAYSNMPSQGRCVWFGIGPWLWSWEIQPPQAHVAYPCGCTASGPAPLPDYCPEHDPPSMRDPVKAFEHGQTLLAEHERRTLRNRV